MKRLSRKEAEIFKRQKTGVEWLETNWNSSKKHADEYGFSFGADTPLNLDNLYMGHLIFIDLYTNSEYGYEYISDLKLFVTETPFDIFVEYTMNLKKHWSDVLYINYTDLKLLDFTTKPDRPMLNHRGACLLMKKSQIHENVKSWYYYDTQLQYSKKPHLKDFVLLRDLKLDRILPIQELFYYLATVFNISSIILESLFWCSDYRILLCNNCNKTHTNRDPVRMLIWNCAELIK